jgi:hypothetical protein
MNDVLTINGERYRKCLYITECCEKTLYDRGEKVEIIEVRPIYKPKISLLELRLPMLKIKLKPGQKITIIVDDEIPW